MASSKVVVFLLSVWIHLSAADNSTSRKGVYYILSSESGDHHRAACDWSQYHDSSFECVVLSGLSEYVHTNYTCNERLVIFFPGMHLVNSSVHVIRWPSVKNETIIGMGNATIVCSNQPLSLEFRNVRYLNMSNIHFVNCSGQLLKFLWLNGYVLLDRMQFDDHSNLSNLIKVVTPILSFGLEPCFELKNSIIRSKGSVGVNVFEPSTKFKLRIGNVSFYNSRLNISFQNLSNTTYYYNISNITFIECICHTLMRLRGRGKVVFNSVHVISSLTRYLIHSSMTSFVFNWHCYFINNTGSVSIEQATLNMTNAILMFMNNSVQTISPLFALCSTFYFEKSHITFEDNYGQWCGGIVANNSLLTFNDTITIFNNESTIVFQRSALLMQ